MRNNQQNCVLQLTRRALWFCAVLFCANLQAANAPDELSEYRSVITTIIDDFNRRSGKAFTQHLDITSILDKTFSGISVPANFEAGFRRQLTNISYKLADKIIDQIPKHGYTKLLRIRKVGSRVDALVRFDLGDSGFGFIEYKLLKNNAGKISIVDWHDHAFGQLYSESVQQIVLLAVPNTSIIDKLLNLGSPAEVKEFLSIVEKINKKQYQDVQTQYQTLNPNLKTKKTTMLIFYQIAAQSKIDTFYAQVLDDLARYHGNDSSIAFVLTDYYFLKKDFARADAIVENLIQHFGVADPALLSLRANIALTAEKYEQAMRYAQQAQTAEPTLEGPYWVYVSVNVTKKSYTEAVKWAKVLEEKFGQDFSAKTLIKHPVLKNLVQTPEYKAWKKIN